MSPRCPPHPRVTSPATTAVPAVPAGSPRLATLAQPVPGGAGRVLAPVPVPGMSLSLSSPCPRPCAITIRVLIPSCACPHRCPQGHLVPISSPSIPVPKATQPFPCPHCCPHCTLSPSLSQSYSCPQGHLVPIPVPAALAKCPLFCPRYDVDSKSPDLSKHVSGGHRFPSSTGDSDSPGDTPGDTVAP